jgi:MFS family permease
VNRGFRLLWLGESTSALGSSVASVALPLVALDTLHASAFQVSLLTAAAWLPWLLIGLLAGVWVDRLKRRRIMLAADLAALVLFLTVPLAGWLDVLTVPLLLVVALLGGTAQVFFATAYRAYLRSVVEPDERVAANARLQGSESAAQVAGPGVAGLLTQVAGAVTGVLVDALTFAVSALCLWRIGDVEQPPARTAERHLLSEVKQGLSFVLRDGYLRTFALFGGTSNLLLVGYQSILVTFLVREVRLSPGTVGVLLAAGQAGGVLGALVARRVASRVGTARFVLATKFVLGLGAMLLPLTTRGAGAAFLVAGIAVVAGSVVAGNVISAGFAQSYCPPELFGRISSSTQVVNLGAIPLGAVLGGTLASSFGLRTAMWVMTALLVPAATILLTGPLRHDRDLPTAARPVAVAA